ncbi:MAG: PEP-CTERM sorting domain-containing protein [Phycisphaerae bacterium]|nr:PEP-CTERM sorting domain-containing protein [Phycisphaerae bacterium]
MKMTLRNPAVMALAAGVFCLLSVGRPAQADLLFKDTFDGLHTYSNGWTDRNYNLSVDLDHRQSGSLVTSPTYMPYSSTGGPAVLTWLGNQGGTYAPSGSGNGSLYSQGDFRASPNHNFTSSTDLAGNGFVVQFDMIQSAGGWTGFYFGAQNGWVTHGGFGVIFRDDQQVLVFGASGSASNLNTTAAYRTIRAEVSLSSSNWASAGAAGAAKTIRLYGDGTLLGTLSTTNAWASNYVTLENASTTAFFDNVSVSSMATTPEPATMAFLATGGLSMIGAGLRRRRVR